MARRTEVFGPAYLDRVLRVDRPLSDSGCPLDQSVDGRWKFGEGLTLTDPEGRSLAIELPDDWPGPTGEVQVSRPLAIARHARGRGLSWQDDLGGMGAGYAAAFGGELVSALGPDDDPTSRAVVQLLNQQGIRHRPIRVPDQASDWTLLVTSGEFGDKLPIGFRGCHAAVGSIAPELFQPCDLRVVASLPNRLAAQALRAEGAGVRFFAPAMRNMLDRAVPVASFAGSIDVLCCNRREWETLADREEVAWRVSLLAVTDGPLGSTIRFTTPTGEAASIAVPAFPRTHPPRDTNRAGEAYAAMLLTVLLDCGWTPGVTKETSARVAAEYASVAAALVLDRLDFGFPPPYEIFAARCAGSV